MLSGLAGAASRFLLSVPEVSQMNDVNVWAVLAAAGTSFLLGGLWYSPKLFGNAWNREAGRGEKSTQSGGHPALVFGLSFLLAVVAAGVLASYLGPAPELGRAVRTGALVGLGFVAASFGINYSFASRSLKLWMI